MAKKKTQIHKASKEASRKAQGGGKPAARKPGGKAPPSGGAKASASKAAAGISGTGKAASAAKAPRSRWLDSASGAVLIEEQARKLTSFIETMADGQVDDGEVEAQEARLVALLKEVEPLLDDATHAKVTRLLCELTAYDIMQILNSLQKARPATRFRG